MNVILDYLEDTAGGRQLDEQQRERYRFLMKNELLLELADVLRGNPDITCASDLEGELHDSCRAAVVAALQRLGAQGQGEELVAGACDR